MPTWMLGEMSPTSARLVDGEAGRKGASGVEVVEAKVLPVASLTSIWEIFHSSSGHRPLGFSSDAGTSMV